MAKTPLVSVIIPVFNGTNYLQSAIDSVLAQTFTDYEIIVVDDGSTDNTWAIIQSYGDKVRGIQKENGGTASAMNCGIRAAVGCYIGWLSHDDLYLPNKLERQVAYMEAHPDLAASYTHFNRIDADGRIARRIESPWYPRAEAVRELFVQMYIHGSTMLIRRSCLAEMGGFREDLQYTQDGEMWLRILSKYEIGRVPEVLGAARIHQAQGSQQISVRSRHEKEHRDLLVEYFNHTGIRILYPDIELLANKQTALMLAYTWLGDVMCRHGWKQEAMRQYVRSVRICPSWQNKAWIRLGVICRAFIASWGQSMYQAACRGLKVIGVRMFVALHSFQTAGKNMFKNKFHYDL